MIRILLMTMGMTCITAFSPPNVVGQDSTTTTWNGTLKTPGGKLRLEIRIVNKAGKLTGELRSLDQNNVKLQATEIKLAGDTLSFNVPQASAKFSGRVGKKGSIAEGTFTQRGVNLPLSLSKSTKGADSDPSDGTKPAPINIEERLATLDKLLEKERIKHKIPGFAIAIVKDNEVVFSKGYGHRDIEAKKPVEPDTLFAIGSSSKAFTGAVVAMLVDEGKMQWDDPVTKFVPEFKMNVDTGDEEISVRDLLCHRTGFTRMGLLWAGGNLTRDEIIQQATQAKPYAGFQEKFLYNNVMYMVAGQCAGRAAKSDWDSLVAERIFKPLGMSDSSTSIRVAQKDPRLSLGYLWDKDREEFVQLPMRNLDSIAPAGSINSNVIDMTKWVRLQLSNGQFDDQRLLSQEQHAETWARQMKIGGRVHYGLGWMLRDWNQKKVVEHGGSIDGFGAQVTLLPELNTGYVLLTNVTATPLQSGSIQLVFDTLFGDTPTPSKGLAGIDTEPLVGNYIANFSQFNNVAMKVLLQNGNLAIDVPGQMIYELKAPDDKGKWYFALTNQIAIAFNRNEEGRVISITMHQNGATPEFIREDVELPPETPIQVTTPLLGKYRDEESKNVIEIVIRKGRLTVDSGKSAFTFLPPGKDGKWAMRVSPDRVQLRFNKSDDGSVRSITRFAGGKELEMSRIGGSNSAMLPTVEELLATVRKGYGALGSDAFVGVRMVGTGDFIHQGAKGTIELVFSYSGGHATRQKFGRMATIVAAFDGKKGVSDSNVGRREELAGRKLKQLKLGHPLWFLDDWKQHYQVAITGESEVDGQKALVVLLTGERVPDRKLYVAAATGLILKEETFAISDAAGDVPITNIYSDYRAVNGIQLPFKTVSTNPFVGTFVVQFNTAEALKELPRNAFVVPPPKDR
jgi:CubicO group peptidase (beta-lactamase class C family)